MGTWEGSGPGKLLHKCRCPWRSTETRKQKGKPVCKQVCQEDGATWALEPFALRRKASLRPRPPTHAHLLFDEPPLLEELPVLRQHALLGLQRHLRGTRGGVGGVQKQSLSTSKSYQDTSEGRLFK